MGRHQQDRGAGERVGSRRSPEDADVAAGAHESVRRTPLPGASHDNREEGCVVAGWARGRGVVGKERSQAS
eukprot:5878833-Alexandrium_andersonii.AAC.1